MKKTIETTRKETAEKTRKVYQKQHENYVDPVIFERFYKMYVDPNYYHLKRSDFEGKHILDAGCGNTAYLQAALHDLGAKHVTCLDLDTEWMKQLDTMLQNRGISKDFYTMISGSTNALPFKDEEFDIVCSNGVLLHLNDPQQADIAFNELARVTRKTLSPLCSTQKYSQVSCAFAL